MDIEQRAQEILDMQRKAINQLEITPGFFDAIKLIVACKEMNRNVITSGMGKAGMIAQKMSATLASIGIPSFYLHPAEGLHGDVGRVQPSDVLIIFSHSGKTQEIKQILTTIDHMNGNRNKIITITGNTTPEYSYDVRVSYDVIQESCIVDKVPSTSTTLMLLIADIIAITAAESLGLTNDWFKIRHPGGAIGESFKKS